MAEINHQVLLKSRPVGWVTEENFDYVAGDMPVPGPGEILVKNKYMSLDPYMRGRMNEGKSYVAPFEIGKVLQAGVVGEVIESHNEKFAVGDHVSGMLGWENYSASNGAGLMKVDPDIAPLSWNLGILGMPGMTAYVGLMSIGEPKEGETLFVSAASGAVGSVVGQLGKIMGLRVVGCAGEDDKVAWLIDELGFDAAFNYKTCGPVYKKMREVCPEGIDINFENVGGEIMEAALWQMKDFGRIILCGMIANYNDTEMTPGPRGMAVMIQRRLKMQGFIVSDRPDLCGEYVQKAAGWVRDGKLKYRETVTEGLENAPRAFIGLLKGENFGKQIVKLD
ncbi:NADP-dependent oxidoreductase [Emcibacter nanhaiensis]|uniref:NADP-dependent oxidoreductase n=1 Tax=Emcibacter nanhaiensis TaxID=1505037 RepID=A0A501PMP9_9PROT|nr:NADP-dependent oxidoreductase [Emcibacter nanhaiensis]TPD61780.1 NADP-dependent oxidoreductase [Emcibacter nanhaiensis]